MIEHCAPQCSSMYRPALHAQPEYVVHRSNWTMIDDVTFPSPLLLFVSSLLLPLSLSCAHTHSILPFPTSRGSNPPQAEHRIGDAQSSRLSLSLSYLFVSSLFPSSLAFLSFSLFLSFYSFWEFSFTDSLFLSVSFYFSILFRSATSPNTSFVPIFVLILPPRRRDTLLQDSRNRKMFRSCGLYRCKWTLARDNRSPHISRPVNSAIQRTSINRCW